MVSPSQYAKHITTEYDEQFKAEKDLRWLPWVGKSFNKTKILVVGMTTDDRDEGWCEAAENDPNTSRGLVAWMDTDNDVPFDFKRAHGAKGDNSKSFKQFSRTFACGADRDDTLISRAALWEMVAFNNFIQRVVPEGIQPWSYETDDFKKAMDALTATIRIIEPRLILVWSVVLVDRMAIGAEEVNEPLGGRTPSCPRVFKGDGVFPPTVGVQHPSTWVGANHQKEWRDFLENDPASKDPIGTLLERLRNHPTK